MCINMDKRGVVDNAQGPSHANQAPPNNRIVPHCIMHHPGVILSVMLSSSDENTSAAAARNTDDASEPKLEDVVECAPLASGISSHGDGINTLPSTGADSDSERRLSRRGPLSFRQIVHLATKASMESEIEKQLVSSLPSDLQVQVRASNNVRESLIQVIKNGLVQRSNEQFAACLQELDDKLVEIKNMASTITDLVSKNNEQGSRIIDLVSENKDQLVQITLLQHELASKQDEMKQLQIQALDRLALLQKSVKALLTQTYELHEYPIPRLFIVLPDNTSSWNPMDLLSNKFRLYFLCECGEHTKSINTKIPHHIHLAKHEGYELARPTEFFQRYGPYVLTILQMLKYGITVAGVAVPALAQLIRPDAVDQVTDGLKSLKDTLEPGVNQAIDYIEKFSADQGQEVVGLSEQLDNNEALEGADLRQLELFLKNKDEKRVLGNLYRTVTTEGHVKWVCIDHYRENYHEKTANAFREAVAVLDGSFDEDIGRVDVTLKSKVQADQFYQALEKSRSVYELKLHLNWETTQGDFKRLRNALPKTNVGVLELQLWHTDGPTSDRLNRSQRYDPVIDIMRHPSIQSFAIRGPQNFSKRSGLLSRDDDFPNLRHLHVIVDQWKDDIPGVNCLVAKSPNLSSLALRSAGYNYGSLQQAFDELVFPPTLRHLVIPLHQWKDDISSAAYVISKALDLGLAVGTGLQGDDNRIFLEAYNAIAEHRTYPLDFKDWDLCIPPPPPKESNQAMTTEQFVEHLLKVYWIWNSSKLDVGKLDELAVGAIAKATTNASAIKALHLERDTRLGDSFINHISNVVSQYELNRITIYTREDEGRVRILESIQWKHLRTLHILLKPGTFETGVMRALVDGVKKESEKVELEEFRFWCDSYGIPVAFPQGDLLQAFLASTSAERLLLEVEMTLEHIMSLLRSIDFSRLRFLRLWMKGFDSAQVDAILDGLQHATELKELCPRYACITDDQKSRMREKGIDLKIDL